MPVIKILPHPEYCPQGAAVTAPAGTSICEATRSGCSSGLSQPN